MLHRSVRHWPIARLPLNQAFVPSTTMDSLDNLAGTSPSLFTSILASNSPITIRKSRAPLSPISSPSNSSFLAPLRFLHTTREESEAGSRSSSPFPGDGSDGEGDGGPPFEVEDARCLLQDVLQFREKNTSSLVVEGKVRNLCTVYSSLDHAGRHVFLQTLAQEFGVQHPKVAQLAKAILDSQDRGEFHVVKAEENLREVLIPQHQWLFAQIGRVERGVKFLVDLRTDLLDLISSSTFDAPSSPHLRALNTSLRDLLTLWFSVGFLELERVTWQSRCDMLQKVSEYEAVHPMRNWTDLKRRVGPFRRCFVFTHGSMPGEPVVVLHTALTKEISSSIKSIVVNPRMFQGNPMSRRFSSFEGDSTSSTAAPQVEDPNFISTAIFYSITSTQKGLQSIELGNYLIKRVVKELQSEFPKMHQFSSLSPVPGFKSWLMSKMADAERGNTTLLTESEMAGLREDLRVTEEGPKAFWSCLRRQIDLNSWFQDEAVSSRLETPLMRLCAQYLHTEKRRGYALDSVANFHLRNGAMMWRLNWKADPSPRGLTNSCGIMVNYRYFLEACEGNSQKYLERQEVESSDQVKHLAKLAQQVAQQSKPIED